MNKHFDEIIIIGLERCQNRIDMVETQLKQQNLPYRIFPAFDGQQVINKSFETITRAPLKAFANFNNTRPRYVVGLFCCGLSHIAAIKYAKMMNLKGILLLEDDVILSPDFAERLKLIEDVPDDADMIYIGAIVTSDKLSKKYKVSDHVWDAQKMSLYATHSFVVTQKGYDVVVKKLMEWEDSLDTLLVDGAQDQTIKTYAVVPFSTYQLAGKSEIDGRKKTLNHTKTLYSSDTDFAKMGGYDRKTKTNVNEITTDLSYIKEVKANKLF